MHCIVANWNGTYKKNQWMSGQPHRGHLAVLAGWPAKVPILKEVTSEKSKSVELNTFATYLSSLSGVIAEYNSNYAQK